MADRKNTNIANGVLNGIVLLCGIIFSVLIGMLFKKYVDMVVYSVGITSFDSGSYAGIAGAPLWSLGFSYIVPAIIGLIATLTRNKCAYITQMVFTIITLVVMGILCIVGALAFSALNIYSYSDCADVLGTCVCSNGYSATFSTGFSCDDVATLGSLSVGVTLMMIFGWFAALAATVTGGILGCGKEQIHPGVIIANGGQQSVTVSHTHATVMQPGAYGGQQPMGYGGQQPMGYGGQPGGQWGQPQGQQPGWGNVQTDNKQY